MHTKILSKIPSWVGLRLSGGGVLRPHDKYYFYHHFYIKFVLPFSNGGFFCGFHLFVLVIVNLLGNFLGENDYVFPYKRDDLQLQVCEVQKKVMKDTNYVGKENQ